MQSPTLQNAKSNFATPKKYKNKNRIQQVEQFMEQSSGQGIGSGTF